jgi:hypothetical protein
MYIVESADGSPPSMVLVGIVSLFHWMSSFSDDNPDPGGTLSVRETLAEVAAAIGDWGIDSGVGMTVNMVCVACKFIEPPGGYGKWIRGQFGSHAGNSEVYDDVRLGLAVAELAVSFKITSSSSISHAARVTPRSAGAAESALSIAQRGGRHSGYLRRAQGMTRQQLERASRSLQKGIR